MACSGLGTAPPNEPECRSTAGPRRVISASASPRIEVDGAGHVGGGHAGVADDDDVAVQPVAPLAQQRGEVRRPGLLLALDEQLHGDGRGVAAGGGEVGAHAEQVEGDVALVVDGAAGVQLRAVGALDDGGLERRVHPQLRRVDRLHVVVPVDERDRGAGVGATATRRRPRARPAVGQISTVGKPVRRSASASHSALRGDVGGVRGIGGDRRDAQPGVEIGVQVVEVGDHEVALGAGHDP